ncbi:MAG TPA: hypothetical protein PLO37_01725 [Candidatus Hydrogenedentes bacterium]|nr:hypothetical protein [Candidatus Hydrogenedentota bacterium]HPG65536.1 hypothetical protein [Candidatus Hydrogenedentota bacterium]
MNHRIGPYGYRAFRAAVVRHRFEAAGLSDLDVVKPGRAVGVE